MEYLETIFYDNITTYQLQEISEQLSIISLRVNGQILKNDLIKNVHNYDTKFEEFERFIKSAKVEKSNSYFSICNNNILYEYEECFDISFYILITIGDTKIKIKYDDRYTIQDVSSCCKYKFLKNMNQLDNNLIHDNFTILKNMDLINLIFINDALIINEFINNDNYFDTNYPNICTKCIV